MNPSDQRSPSIDDSAIDRLVDGELSEPERRDLFLALESDTDGWRRCALAFLEDQCIRKALGNRSSSQIVPDPVLSTANSSEAPKRRLRRLSMAASIIGLAFTVGFAAGGISKDSPKVDLVDSKPSILVAPKAKANQKSAQQVGFINIVDGKNGELPYQRLPILSDPSIDEKVLRDQPPSVPDYVRTRLERQGYQVAERRKLVSVTLDDGRRVSIPIDVVALDYVGQNPL